MIGVDTGDSKSPFPTTEAVLRNGAIPIGASLVFAVAVATWLGWWRDIVRCDIPVRRWVWLVPIMIVVALIAINYGRLGDQTVGLVLTLILMTACVGFTEELMFRGIGVNVFRKQGFSEGKVALWSSIVFGLVHLSNEISEGPQAIGQAAIVSSSGYFFYLVLRAASVIFLPMFVHGLWDFSLLSSLAGQPDPKVYFGMFLVLVLQVVLIVVLIVRRHRIEPAASLKTAEAPN